MIEAQLNYFDLIIIGIMFFSCVFAFFRGFVREMLSLIAWVGAGVVTIYYFPAASEMLRPNFTKPLAAAITAAAILYAGSLMCFAIFNRFIIKILKSGSGISALDNLLGLVFGALRGALIISLGYFILSLTVSESKHPEWMTKSVTRPYAEAGAVLLAKIAPEYLSEVSSLHDKANSHLRSDDLAITDDNSHKVVVSKEVTKDVILKDNTPKEQLKNFDDIIRNSSESTN